MTATPPGPAGQHTRPGLARLAVRLLAFAALWAVLSGGVGWGIGLPAVVLAAVATPLVMPARGWSLAGLIRFIPYFLWHSLRGGVDVAARALRPDMPIDPAVLRYEMQLDSAAARVLMANSVTLLPGTLSTELQGKVLSVHVLNAQSPVMEMLATLERRVAALTGHDVQPGPR